jgi:hypothetical protein
MNEEQEAKEGRTRYSLVVLNQVVLQGVPATADAYDNVLRKQGEKIRGEEINQTCFLCSKVNLVAFSSAWDPSFGLD